MELPGSKAEPPDLFFDCRSPCLAPDRVWPTTPTLDRWDEATGENLIERITAAGDYQVAVETYRAVVKRWPKDKITLRNRARVLEWSWRD